jgi:excisionase family DNA binding protein
MKSRPTQFGVRENPDSPRVHGLRPSVNPSLTSMKEFVVSQDEENVSSAPSCELAGLDVPSAGLANEITIEKEKRVHRLLPAEPVKGVPAKPVRPTESSGEGRELPQLKSENRFEPLLDVVEAAKLLRMHPRTLRAKARKRLVPAIQVGRRWRFRASTLNSWLEGLPG